jgi:hypothetical protein
VTEPPSLTIEALFFNMLYKKTCWQQVFLTGCLMSSSFILEEKLMLSGNGGYAPS